MRVAKSTVLLALALCVLTMAGLPASVDASGYYSLECSDVCTGGFLAQCEAKVGRENNPGMVFPAGEDGSDRTCCVCANNSTPEKCQKTLRCFEPAPVGDDDDF